MKSTNVTCLAVILNLAVLPALVIAEESDDEVGMIITGSHIKRIDEELSLPLLILTDEDIVFSGVTNLADLLQTTVFSNGSSQNNQQTSGFTPGASNYNLRGLRTDRTLILVDGKRLPSYPFGQNGNIAFVDLNTIPLAEIERVEILKDGASAVYGSDAISGVVNIITKQEFYANELILKTTQASSNYSANFLSFFGGRSTDDSELLFTAEYQNYNELLGKDTNFANSLNNSELNEYSFPGTYFTSTEAIPGEGCERVESGAAFNYAGNICVNDWAKDRQLLPENERLAVSLKWIQDLGEDTFYSHLSLNRITTNSNVESGYVFGDLFVPASNPNNPLDENINFFSRGLTEIGLQNIETVSNNYRIVMGIKGLISIFNSQYDYDFSFNDGRTKIDETYNKGWMTIESANRLFTEFNNGTLNPFQELTTSQIDSFTEKFSHKGDSRQSALSFSISGDLLELSSGNVLFASGIEVRSESIKDTSDQAILNGEVFGLGSSEAIGDRDMLSFFGELAIPLSDSLDVNVALRYDEYSDFGASVNPKISLKYVIGEHLVLRSSWGTGFRAPNLFELLSGDTKGSVAITLADESDIFIPFVRSGNSELKAETSENINVGFVIDFDKKFSFSLDAWEIDVNDMITNLGVSTILSTVDENDELVFQDQIIFNSDGTFSHIEDQFLNINNQKAQGVDLISTLYISENFVWKFSAAHLLKLEQNNDFIEDVLQIEGKYLFPKTRINSSLSWSSADYGHSLLAYRISSNGEAPFVNAGQTKYDYQFQYNLGEHNITFMILNIMDKQPPSNGSSVWPFYEQRAYSPLGRNYSLQWKYYF